MWSFGKSAQLLVLAYPWEWISGNNPEGEPLENLMPHTPAPPSNARSCLCRACWALPRPFPAHQLQLGGGAVNCPGETDSGKNFVQNLGAVFFPGCFHEIFSSFCHRQKLSQSFLSIFSFAPNFLVILSEDRIVPESPSFFIFLFYQFFFKGPPQKIFFSKESQP